MSKGKQTIGLVVLLGMVFLLACAPQAPAPSPAPSAPTAMPAPVVVAKAPAPAAPARPAWEVKWEAAQTAAKQEGKVVVITTGTNMMRQAMVKGMKDAFGINAEVVVGRGTDILEKVLAERRAGLYLTDIHVGGIPPMYQTAKPAGILEPLDSSLILPDVTDPERIKSIWYEGKLHWVDQDHTLLVLSVYPAVTLALNTDLVKPDELKSYRDLLNPKWKGKLLMNDPTVAGAGQNAFMAIEGLMGTDFIKELAKAEPMLMRDQRLMLQWLATGKVAILVFPQTEGIPEFVAIGAPISAVTPVEGTYLTAGSSGLDRFKNAPHSNAATVFINWITSKEGQEVFAPAAGLHSNRLDVSTAFLRPDQMRQPGVKYFDAYTETAIKRRTVTDKLAKEIFGPLVK